VAERQVVLALGGGGARGLAHIGVLQVLAENRIPVRAVAGTSVGAEIGAFLASGMPLEEMAQLATAFDWKLTLQLFLPDLPTGGLVSGKKILNWLNDKLGEFTAIEDLPMPYLAVASDLETGEEVILDRGPLTEAVRASISLPGTLAPFRIGERALVDGGVVNPLPFDVARRRFGGPVVAVAVHAGSQHWDRRRPRRKEGLWRARFRQLLEETWMGRAQHMREGLEARVAESGGLEADAVEWSARLVLERVLAIGEMQIVELRSAASPPDVMIVPDVHDIGSLEFYRAVEAIEAGRAAARAKLAEIARLVGCAS
jgi:NTE family protein